MALKKDIQMPKSPDDDQAVGKARAVALKKDIVTPKSQDDGKAVYRQADSDRDDFEARRLSPELLGLVNDVGQAVLGVVVVKVLDDDDKFGVNVGTECGRDDGTDGAKPGVKSRSPCGGKIK